MSFPRSLAFIAAGIAVVGVGAAIAWRSQHPSPANGTRDPSLSSVRSAQPGVSEGVDSIRPQPATAAGGGVADRQNSEGPFTDAGLAAEAKSRASRSGAEAMAWAKAQADPSRRERFVSAVLRAWAELDPKAAIEWLRQHDDLGEKAWEAAFIGAAKQPALLLEAARKLVAVDPIKGATQGAILLASLASVGQYGTAAEFACGAPAELREDWIKAAFRRWSGDKPEEAARALKELGDDSSRAIAFPALVDGWALKSPGGLAAYAITLPEGDSRGYAVGQAMLKWCEQDPSALASWLGNVKSRAEYDLGAMLLVTQTDRANRSTDLALRWTESISDPELKRESFQHVLTEWLQTDPRAARSYVAQAPWINPAERSSLLQDAAAPPPEEP